MELIITNIIHEIYSPEQCTIIGINENFQDIITKIKEIIQRFLDHIKNLFNKFAEHLRKNNDIDKNIIKNKSDIINKAKQTDNKVISIIKGIEFTYKDIIIESIPYEYLKLLCSTDTIQMLFNSTKSHKERMNDISEMIENIEYANNKKKYYKRISKY